MAYRASYLRILAIAQTVFGGLMFVFGIASASAVNHWASSAGFGIWVGILVSTMRDNFQSFFETFVNMIW